MANRRRWTPERGLEARRVAAARMEPMRCGCRDPIFECFCQDDEPLSERDLDAWAAAAAFLLAHGTVPIMPVAVKQQLWWRGVTDRLLMTWSRAEMTHGGEVA